MLRSLSAICWSRPAQLPLQLLETLAAVDLARRQHVAVRALRHAFGPRTLFELGDLAPGTNHVGMLARQLQLERLQIVPGRIQLRPDRRVGQVRGAARRAGRARRRRNLRRRDHALERHPLRPVGAQGRLEVLELGLRPAEGFQVGRHRRRQLVREALAVFLDLRFLLLELRARVVQLRLDERRGRFRGVLAIGGVLLDEGLRQAVGHHRRRLRVRRDKGNLEERAVDPARIALDDLDAHVAAHAIGDIARRMRFAPVLVETGALGEFEQPRVADDLLPDGVEALLDRNDIRAVHQPARTAGRGDEQRRFRPELIRLRERVESRPDRRQDDGDENRQPASPRGAKQVFGFVSLAWDHLAPHLVKKWNPGRQTDAEHLPVSSN